MIGTFKKLFNFPLTPVMRVSILSVLGFFPWLEEKFIKFKLTFGYNLTLKNLNTLNKKADWLNLYARELLYAKLPYKCKVNKGQRIKLGKSMCFQYMKEGAVFINTTIFSRVELSC